MTSLFYNISEALTLEGVVKKKGSKLLTSDLSLIKDASIVTEDGKILWVGEKANLPKDLEKSVQTRIDCKNKVVTPALIDSHTHLVFAGNRANEFVMRLSGASYEEIAHAGGGIKYSSQQTNQASSEELFNLAKDRLNQLYELGVAACEIKTGYSLTLDGEINLLEIINKLKIYFASKIHIHRTLLSAHATPPGVSADDYIESVVLPSIEKAALNKLADSVDVFHEKNYFDEVHVAKIFNQAKKFNLKIRIHADELNNNHGALLASQHGCLSADHLLNTDSAGAKAMSDAGVIATLLPGTAFFLGKPLANAKMLLAQGCAVAIASDFNPGSSYINDVFHVARMSTPTLGLNPAAFWSAISYNAARSLNLNSTGAIVIGFEAKLLCWDVSDSNELLYDWTRRPKCAHLKA